MAGGGRPSDDEARDSPDADAIPDDVAVAAEARLQASLTRYLALSSSLQQVGNVTSGYYPPCGGMRCNALLLMRQVCVTHN